MDGVITRTEYLHAAAWKETFDELLRSRAWQALMFGFLNVSFNDVTPQVDVRAAERLPAGWDSVELTLAYRGHSHAVRVARVPEGKGSS